MTNNVIKIETGLVGKISFDILNSVIGQLSDGMWENYLPMEGYWNFVEIDIDSKENVHILINDCCGKVKKGEYIKNKFYTVLKFDTVKIKNFFVNRLKDIIKEEIGCLPCKRISNVDHNIILKYITMSKDNPISLYDCKCVINKLKS